MNDIYLLVTLYAILIPAFLYTTNKHKKILDFIKESIKQYVEFMDSVPLKNTIGK